MAFAFGHGSRVAAFGGRMPDERRLELTDMMALMTYVGPAERIRPYVSELPWHRRRGRAGRTGR
jgi:hypothetical protein